MHSKYIKHRFEWVTCQKYPRYAVHPEGRVRDTHTGELIPVYIRDGDVIVDLVSAGVTMPVKLVDLVLTAYKPHYIPEELSQGIVHYTFIDGDRVNCHAGNLIWLYRNKIGVPGYPGFYYIPDFTRYGVDVDGTVVHIASGEQFEAAIDARGYANYIMTSDYERSKIGRHRVIVSTFNGFDERYYGLVSNHINGIPGDDRPENLELCSSRDNVVHALATGIRRDIPQVVVLDNHTGVISTHVSQADAARHIGYQPPSIHYALKQPANRLFMDRYQFMYKDAYDELGFPEARPITVSGRAATVFVLDRDGNETLHQTILSAAKFIGVSTSRFSSYLNSNCQLIYNGYRAKLGENTPWKDISAYREEITPNMNLVFMYRVTNLKSDESWYYFRIKTARELPDFKLKQISQQYEVDANTWSYKYYLIERVSLPFSSQSDRTGHTGQYCK